MYNVLPLANLIITDNFVKTMSSSCKLFIENRWRNLIVDDKRKKAHAQNKLRTYKNFKQSFSTSKYEIECQNRSNRRALALFRCCCDPIALETGRYRNVPYEESVVFFVILVT